MSFVIIRGYGGLQGIFAMKTGYDIAWLCTSGVLSQRQPNPLLNVEANCMLPPSSSPSTDSFRRDLLAENILSPGNATVLEPVWLGYHSSTHGKFLKGQY